MTSNGWQVDLFKEAFLILALIFFKSIAMDEIKIELSQQLVSVPSSDCRVAVLYNFSSNSSLRFDNNSFNRSFILCEDDSIGCCFQFNFILLSAYHLLIAIVRTSALMIELKSSDAYFDDNGST